ncbi:hypothetical protein ACWFQ8_25205 [Streptomyces sp. NPDC055254]
MRAALAVGATVTPTHTAGVLVMGLILTAGGGFVGEQLLGWLGAISGAVIAVLGMALAVTAVRACGRDGTRHTGTTDTATGTRTAGHENTLTRTVAVMTTPTVMNTGTRPARHTAKATTRTRPTPLRRRGRAAPASPRSSA